MSVKYRHYQSNNPNSSKNGYWYARAVHNETVDLDYIAERIQRNSTAKKSDVLAVLTEMVEVMRDELQAGKRVKIDEMGTFKIAITSIGAKELKDFTVKENIKGVKLLFMPVIKRDATGKSYKPILRGTVVQEHKKYDKETTQP